MKTDVIVIGSGFGGLSCAAKLAKAGLKVLVLEKNPHIGGTSYVFRRGPYSFPMGPLGFSHPEKMLSFLDEIGVKSKPGFTRNHFQLVSPYLDIVYSLPFNELKEELKKRHGKEKGLDGFFSELEEISALLKDMSSWHPGYLLGNRKKAAQAKLEPERVRRIKRLEELSRTPCSSLLDRHIQDQWLKNLLGSMGVHPPRMSVLNLAIMWKLMSIEGIWSPSCGIHGLIDEIAEAFTSQGGVLATGRPVEEILISKGLAVGVKTGGGDVHESRWVVSNADYKKTFLQLVNRDHLSAGFLKSVEDKPYTGSELCLYLGLNPEKVDWRAMKARHLFFTPGLDEHNPREQDNADSLEIEICLWSDTVPNMTPADKKAMVIRSSFPFSKFELYWTGEKQRTTGYQEYKKELADQLLRAAEHVLPGLASAVETREAATPLTYRDWGQRYLGSIAGWSWQARENELGGKFLIETPIRGLLMTGVYAATELLFGGVPTAVHTGGLAADHIRQSL